MLNVITIIITTSIALIPTHEENDAMLWYLVLRGACSFLMENGRWPGCLQPYIKKYKVIQDDNQNSNSPRVNVAVSSSSTDRKNLYTSKNSDTDNDDIIELDLPILRIHLNRVLRSFGIASNRVSTDYLEVRFIDLTKFNNYQCYVEVFFVHWCFYKLLIYVQSLTN